MSARLLFRLLTAAWVAACLVWVVAAIILVAAPALGEPLVTHWPVLAEPSGIESPFRFDPAVTAVLLDAAPSALTVEHRGYGLSWLLRLSDLVVSGGVILCGLGLLRAFTGDVRDGLPFSPGSARRLQWIGVLLLVFPVWQLVRDLLWHGLLLHQWIPGSGVYQLAPVWGPAGEYVMRLAPDPDLGFALAGVLMLVVAEAFRIGIALREDAEEII